MSIVAIQSNYRSLAEKQGFSLSLDQKELKFSLKGMYSKYELKASVVQNYGIIQLSSSSSSHLDTFEYQEELLQMRELTQNYWIELGREYGWSALLYHAITEDDESILDFSSYRSIVSEEHMFFFRHLTPRFIERTKRFYNFFSEQFETHYHFLSTLYSSLTSYKNEEDITVDIQTEKSTLADIQYRVNVKGKWTSFGVRNSVKGLSLWIDEKEYFPTEETEITRLVFQNLQELTTQQRMKTVINPSFHQTELFLYFAAPKTRKKILLNLQQVYEAEDIEKHAALRRNKRSISYFKDEIFNLVLFSFLDSWIVTYTDKAKMFKTLDEAKDFFSDTQSALLRKRTFDQIDDIFKKT